MKEFKVGQSVQMSDDGEIVTGKVVEVLKTIVKIKWDDLSSICQHASEEWEEINIVNN